MANKSEKQPGKSKRKADKQIEDSGKKFSFSQIGEFASEVKTEFNKIAWPDKKHTAASTMVVVLLVVIMGVYLGTVDLLLGKLVSYVLG